ncbi:hypothetical protein EK904_010042 [Melospiza melodia maxima]|nr:hypothetical protein EK904_010042 [Melospiza melodia maxima]
MYMDLSVEMQKTGHALQSADLPNFTGKWMTTAGVGHVLAFRFCGADTQGGIHLSCLTPPRLPGVSRYSMGYRGMKMKLAQREHK